MGIEQIQRNYFSEKKSQFRPDLAVKSAKRITRNPVQIKSIEEQSKLNIFGKPVTSAAGKSILTDGVVDVRHCRGLDHKSVPALIVEKFTIQGEFASHFSAIGGKREDRLEGLFFLLFCAQNRNTQ
jgi:hypothetical protein